MGKSFPLWEGEESNGRLDYERPMAGTKLGLKSCAPWGYTDWCGLLRKAVFGCGLGGKSHSIERLRNLAARDGSLARFLHRKCL